MADHRIEDLLPFYALGVLSDEEAKRVEAYLVANPAARAELTELGEGLAPLPHGAPPVPPPAHLKTGLMKRIRTGASRTEAAPQPVAPRTPSWTDQLGRWLKGSDRFLIPSLVGLCLITALAAGLWAYKVTQDVETLRQEIAALNQEPALLNQILAETDTVKNGLLSHRADLADIQIQLAGLEEERVELARQVQAQKQILTTLQASAISGSSEGVVTELVQQISTQNAELTALTEDAVPLLAEQVSELKQEVATQRRALAQLTTPDVQAMIIAGTETFPRAQGNFITSTDRNSGLLIVGGLPKLQPGLEYHFWLVEDGAPQRVGVLDVDEQGVGMLLISSRQQTFGAYEGMGISIEPAGSRGAPTSEMVMLGQFSS